MESDEKTDYRQEMNTDHFNSKLKILTWNIQNLGETKNNRSWVMDSIAESLVKENPDVICIVELRNVIALIDLCRALNSKCCQGNNCNHFKRYYHTAPSQTTLTGTHYEFYGFIIKDPNDVKAYGMVNPAKDKSQWTVHHMASHWIVTQDTFNVLKKKIEEDIERANKSKKIKLQKALEGFKKLINKPVETEDFPGEAKKALGEESHYFQYFEVIEKNISKKWDFLKELKSSTTIQNSTISNFVPLCVPIDPTKRKTNKNMLGGRPPGIIKLEHSGKKYYLMACHLRPHAETANAQIKRLVQLDLVSESTDAFIITGDFNIKFETILQRGGKPDKLAEALDKSLLQQKKMSLAITRGTTHIGKTESILDNYIYLRCHPKNSFAIGMKAVLKFFPIDVEIEAAIIELTKKNLKKAITYNKRTTTGEKRKEKNKKSKEGYANKITKVKKYQRRNGKFHSDDIDRYMAGLISDHLPIILEI